MILKKTKSTFSTTRTKINSNGNREKKASAALDNTSYMYDPGIAVSPKDCTNTFLMAISFK